MSSEHTEIVQAGELCAGMEVLTAAIPPRWEFIADTTRGPRGIELNFGQWSYITHDQSMFIVRRPAPSPVEGERAEGTEWVCDWHAERRERCTGPGECPKGAWVDVTVTTPPVPERPVGAAEHWRAVATAYEAVATRPGIPLADLYARLESEGHDRPTVIAAVFGPAGDGGVLTIGQRPEYEVRFAAPPVPVEEGEREFTIGQRVKWRGGLPWAGTVVEVLDTAQMVKVVADEGHGYMARFDEIEPAAVPVEDTEPAACRKVVWWCHGCLNCQHDDGTPKPHSFPCASGSAAGALVEKVRRESWEAPGHEDVRPAAPAVEDTQEECHSSKPHGQVSKPGADAMAALLQANRAVQADDRYPRGALAGAATHTGAALLTELERIGWVLAPRGAQDTEALTRAIVRALEQVDVFAPGTPRLNAWPSPIEREPFARWLAAAVSHGETEREEPKQIDAGDWVQCADAPGEWALFERKHERQQQAAGLGSDGYLTTFGGAFVSPDDMRAALRIHEHQSAAPATTNEED